MDDITALQTMTPDRWRKDAVVFKPRDAVHVEGRSEEPDRSARRQVVGGRSRAARHGDRLLPEDGADGDVMVTITNTATGQAVRTCVGTGNAGMNRFQWALTGDPQPGGGGGGGGGGGEAAVAARASPIRTRAAPTGPTPCSARRRRRRTRRRRWRWRLRRRRRRRNRPRRLPRHAHGRRARIGTQTFKLLEDTWLNEK